MKLWLCVLLALSLGVVAGRLTSTATEGQGAAAVSPTAHSVEQFRAALREHDLSKRSEGLAEFLDGLGPDNIDAAVKVLETNRIGVVDYEMKMIMFSWTRFDPAAALAWAKTDNWGQKGMSQQAALFAWGFRDPHAAIARLTETGESDSESPLLGAVIAGWSRNGDVQGVTNFIMASPASRTRSMQANNLAAIISNASIDSAVAWADSVPVDSPELFKQIAYMRTMSAVAQRDPERAMRWYEEHQGRDYTEGALDVLARRFIEYHDPEALFIWLQELPAPSIAQEGDGETASAIGVGFRAWLRRDAKSASRWIEEQPTLPPVLDPAIVEFARHLSSGPRRKNPQIAIAWAERIQDPQLRAETIIPIAKRWKDKDPEAMQAWLTASNLPEETRTQILTPPKKAARAPMRVVPSINDRPGRVN